MQFVFNEKKAAQAAAFLLERHGRPMSKDTLIRLLYLADRQSLIDTGRPITGDLMISTKDGPTLKTISALLNADKSPFSFLASWWLYIQRRWLGRLDR